MPDGLPVMGRSLRARRCRYGFFPAVSLPAGPYLLPMVANVKGHHCVNALRGAEPRRLRASVVCQYRVLLA
jgi:hypothetical protein